jgi:hypothetical protein
MTGNSKNPTAYLTKPNSVADRNKTTDAVLMAL